LDIASVALGRLAPLEFALEQYIQIGGINVGPVLHFRFDEGHEDWTPEAEVVRSGLLRLSLPQCADRIRRRGTNSDCSFVPRADEAPLHVVEPIAPAVDAITT